ncbi:baseplate J/gp47 family protein [Chromobacterium sphagni]|uniref:Phage tail protein n=1 Tax=Chromobacterium sphagni TaxID=1903179 RepID=A0ABX3CGM4_9NEIS|nr:baseplate J/gp47 family protein [Chromobacterium sphagni]OHX21253.1 phage tail protein [Chromobacterium sphagni]
MPFTTLDMRSVRDALLRDLRNQRPDVDTTPDSDWFVRATSVASAVEGLYQHQAWLTRQIFPDTADRDYLELHARVRGLSRKNAVAAAGQLRLQGSPGATAPAGLTAKAAGQSYTTTQGATLDASGAAIVTVNAAAPGLAGNIAAGAVAELASAPSGIASQASVVNMSGGADAESDGELLARLLELIRRPPAGGNRYDYHRWAMEVDGVTAAYVYPLRRGLGTVDVAVTMAGGAPSSQVLAAVQQHIDDMRPVTARNCLVFAPTPRLVDLDIRVLLSGTTLAIATEQVKDTVSGYFAALAPGETAVRSRIELLVSAVAGVADRQIMTPIANVVPKADASTVEWLRLGTVNMRTM